MGTIVQAKVARNREERSHRIRYENEGSRNITTESSTESDTQMDYTETDVLHGDGDLVCDSAAVSNNSNGLTGNHSDLSVYNCVSSDKIQSNTEVQLERKNSPEASEARNQLQEDINSGEKHEINNVPSDDIKKSETLSAEGRKRKWSRFESLRNEDVRLQTFDNWPEYIQFINPEELAKAGFFYLKKDDIVQCAFCRGMVGIWEKGDDPLSEHQRHFPQCHFVLKIDVGNSPQSGSEQSKNGGYDTVSRYIHGMCPTVNKQSTELLRNFNIKTINGNQSEDIKALGVNSYTGPYNSSFVRSDERLVTFSEWPLSLPQPARLAEAGFYYVHLSDHVKCFYCNGGLRNWKPDDDPWIEHARWFPKCQYVLLLKGQEFVDMVTGNTGKQPRKQTVYDETVDWQNNSATIKLTQQKTENSGASNVTNQLEEENRRLKAAYTCKICLDKEVGVVFLPCGHLVTCAECATAVSKCPMCRQPILGMARTFLN